MIDTSQLDVIAQKLYKSLPKGLLEIEADVKETFRTILESAFSELNLVTREEFDAQVKVLARTREKVETLQKHLNELSDKYKP